MSIFLGNTPIANTGYDKANTDLSNLTSTGKNIANWSNNVTNCITEIPQDIKLELNNGTLTLKAGSKVYVPNGSGVFNEIITPSDRSTIYSGNGKHFVVINASGYPNVVEGPSRAVSGSTDSMSGETWHIWYDTTNNIINRYGDNATTPAYNTSFPIALVTVSNGAISSIDQVFNGFGYIGSTVFALPNVKGLIPNGRNKDGSLKSTKITISNVLTGNLTVASSSHDILLQSSGIYFDDDIYEPNWQFVYKEPENIIVNTGNGLVLTGILFARCRTDSSAKITSFTPRTAFHALDYNNSSTISGWSMPSSRYIDLTLGASGSKYTAPANGWFFLQTQVGGTDKRYIEFVNETSSLIATGSIAAGLSSSNRFRINIPARKGDTVTVLYYSGAEDNFRFIYAEGEN